MKVTPTPTTWVMGRPARAQVTNEPPVSVSQGEIIKNTEGENPKIQKGKQKVLEAPGTRKTGLQSHGGAENRENIGEKMRDEQQICQEKSHRRCRHRLQHRSTRPERTQLADCWLAAAWSGAPTGFLTRWAWWERCPRLESFKSGMKAATIREWAKIKQARISNCKVFTHSSSLHSVVLGIVSCLANMFVKGLKRVKHEPKSRTITGLLRATLFPQSSLGDAGKSRQISGKSW